MTKHPAIEVVTDRISRDVIGGAVDTAREVMDAIAQVAEESQAESIKELYAELDNAAYAVLKICPSFAPPINVLHIMIGTIEEDLRKGATVSDAKENLSKIGRASCRERV